MKKLKRRAAGALSAVMLVTTAIPVPAAVGETRAEDTVTVEVENVPGGALIFEEEETGMIFPLDRPVEIKKGNHLSFYESTAYYEDDSQTVFVGLSVNGEWLSETAYENEFFVDKDMVITPVFIRVQDEDLEEYSRALYSDEDEEDEWANENSRQLISFKGSGDSFTLSKKQTESGLEEQLYDRRSKKKISGDFEIDWVRRYNAEHSRGEEVTLDAKISEDGIFYVSGMETGYSYRFRIYQMDGDRRKATGTLTVNVGINRIVPNYPVAEGESIEDAYGTGTAVYVTADSTRIADALKDTGNLLYGTTLRGWTDENGKNIGSQTIGSLTDTGSYGVYADYSDYKLPKIEKPEIAVLTQIEENEEGAYYFVDSGKPVTKAFVGDGSTWHYLDENGMPMKDYLIQASPDTLWYQDTGYGYMTFRKDENAKKILLYYVTNTGKMLTGAWVAIPQEGSTEGNETYDWYYFSPNGNAYADEFVTIAGNRYQFDEDGVCIIPGWTRGENGWRFLDADGKPVKKAFAISNGEKFYLDADGYVLDEAQVVQTNRNTKVWSVAGEAETMSARDGGPGFQSVVYSTPDKDYKYRTIYYMIGEDGSIEINTWDDETSQGMYFGADGKALQSCSTVIEGKLFTFDKAGAAEQVAPLETDKPTKVAKAIEDLDLFVSEDDANTKEKAKAYVQEAVTALLPMGFEIATLSDAKKAGDKAFQAAEDGTDGFWKYDVTITNGNTEDVATPASASKARKPRVATGSTADGKFTATAENCELRIAAVVVETDEAFEEVMSDVNAALAALSLTQENTPDQKAAEDAIKAAIEAVLPEGYTASYRFEYKAPVTGTRADRDGTDGWIKVICTVTDPAGYEMTLENTLGIEAEAYSGSSSSGSGSSGGSGSVSGAHAAVLDTAGTWQQDQNGWRFLVEGTNTYAQNAWHRINGRWYYFGNNTYAVKGWNLVDGKWYYMDPVNCWMQTGWVKDTADGNWYFMNADGSLALGWVKLENKFYYLNDVSAGPTYVQDPQTGSWSFNGNGNTPYGAMLLNARTPDGYWVGADGVWDGQPRA